MRVEVEIDYYMPTSVPNELAIPSTTVFPRFCTLGDKLPGFVLANSYLYIPLFIFWIVVFSLTIYLIYKKYNKKWIKIIGFLMIGFLVLSRAGLFFYYFFFGFQISNQNDLMLSGFKLANCWFMNCTNYCFTKEEFHPIINFIFGI